MGYEAFVSLATNDYYSIGALALGHSLRKACTTRSLILLISNSVTPEMRNHLSRVWDELVVVEELDSNDSHHLSLLSRPELGVTFSKLHAWRLLEYSKCVFLDADTLVLQNVDELFDREELSAAPDIGWPDCFNSGVFVFEPSEETFSKLVALASQAGSFDGGDQGLLNMFWSDWGTKDIKKRLPFIYNVTPNVAYGYTPAYIKFRATIKIVHFIGPVKPWQHQYIYATGEVIFCHGTYDSQKGAYDFIKRWWEIWTSLEKSLKRSIKMIPAPQPSSNQVEEESRKKSENIAGSMLRATRGEDSERVRHAEERAQQTETRAQLAVQEADRQIREAKENQAIAEQRVQIAELQIRIAEGRVQEGKEREEMAQARADLEEGLKRIAERRCQEAERRCQEIEQRCQEAEQRCLEAEQRSQEAEEELREVKHHWMIRREDVEITDVELGRGGWGVVKIANFCGMKVAAKCFYSELSSPYYQQLFEREMNMAARLRHPNLVQFIGASMEGEPMIVMELMTRSLRNLLESGPISQRQVTLMCIDVALALNYLHKIRPDPVIHRDLSSANVLLNPLPDNQWRAKISDYGSVNLLTQLRTVGPGSPVYAAPEANDPQLQSPKMDVFSFGVLMIEMITDQFPEVRVRRRLIGSIAHAGYVRLINQCLEEDKERRPSAQELLTQLNEFQE